MWIDVEERPCSKSTIEVFKTLKKKKKKTCTGPNYLFLLHLDGLKGLPGGIKYVQNLFKEMGPVNHFRRCVFMLKYSKLKQVLPQVGARGSFFESKT